MAFSTFILNVRERTIDGTKPTFVHVRVYPLANTAGTLLKIVKDTAGNTVMSGHADVKADASQITAGLVAITLPDPRDTTLNPTGFGYRVDVQTNYFSHSETFGPTEIGMYVSGESLELEDVTSVTTASFDATFASQASLSATAAAGSATAAATSATSAAASATAAGSSATSAGTQATNAGTSATNAATSATAAAGSASTASTQAGAASTSASNAATSATAASTSATNAATSATSAAGSASSAAAAVSSEVTRATAAETALQNLTNSTFTAALNNAYAQVFTPEKFGAVGNGTTDDTAALQSMFTAAMASSTKPRILITRSHKISGSGSIFTLTRSCEIFGGGTLKIASSNGTFESIFDAGSNDVTDLHIHDLHLDGNNTGNPLTAGQITSANLVGGNRKAITFDNGGNITIQRVTFHDFDSEWVISSAGAGRVRLLDCGFFKIGNTTSSLFHDHSTVYLDAKGVIVAGCTFSSAEAGVITGIPINYGACSAIEVHGQTQNVHDNTVIGYCNFGQLCPSTFSGTDLIDWHDNHAFSCGHGLSIVPYSTTGMTNVKIHHNTFDLDYLTWRNHPFVSGGAGITLSLVATATIRNFEITDNTIIFRPGAYTGLSKLPGQLSSGIVWWRQDSGHVALDYDIKVNRNVIVGAPDCGIYLLFASVDGLEVSDNVIRDANTAANDSAGPYSKAVQVGAYESGNNGVMSRNKVIDDQTASNSPYGNTAHTLSRGYAFFSAVTAGVNNRALDNGMFIADGTAISYMEAANGGATVLIRGQVPDTPANSIVASGAAAGSEVICAVDGSTRRQATSPKGSTWRRAKSREAAPTVAAEGGLGTSPPSVTVTGNDDCGVIAFGTGTGPGSAFSGLVKLTFATPNDVAPRAVLFTPASTGAAGISGQWLAWAPTAAQFEVLCSVALAASQGGTTYKLFYQVVW